MPSGKVHARIAGTLLLPLTVAGSYLYMADPALSIGWFAGSVMGILITPDIDQDGTTLEEARFYRISFLAGILWQWLWWPYARIFKHRGVSHMYLIGTATRFLYINYVIIPVICVFITGADVIYCYYAGCPYAITVFDYSAIPWIAYVGAFGAWAIQDAGHTFMDKRQRYTKSFRRNAWRFVLIGAFSTIVYLINWR